DLNNITVSFEGFENPGDSLVRPGSGVVRYHLDFIENSKYYWTKNKFFEDKANYFIVAVIIGCFIFLLIVSYISSFHEPKEHKVENDHDNSVYKSKSKDETGPVMVFGKTTKSE